MIACEKINKHIIRNQVLSVNNLKQYYTLCKKILGEQQ